MAIWYIFSRFGNLYQEKSGNPAANTFPRKKMFPTFRQKRLFFCTIQSKQNFMCSDVCRLLQRHFKWPLTVQVALESRLIKATEKLGEKNGPSIFGHCTRVARWFVFKPKIQSWVNFGGSCNGRCWYILCTLGPFYGLLLYFMDIWYSWL
jgi:hypothetical protein